MSKIAAAVKANRAATHADKGGQAATAAKAGHANATAKSATKAGAAALASGKAAVSAIIAKVAKTANAVRPPRLLEGGRPGRPPKYDAQFGRRVARELKGAKHRSLRALAQKLGVPPSTLHDIVTQMGLAASLPRRVRHAEKVARARANGAKGASAE